MRMYSFKYFGRIRSVTTFESGRYRRPNRGSLGGILDSGGMAMRPNVSRRSRRVAYFLPMRLRTPSDRIPTDFLNRPKIRAVLVKNRHALAALELDFHPVGPLWRAVWFRPEELALNGYCADFLGIANCVARGTQRGCAHAARVFGPTAILEPFRVNLRGRCAGFQVFRTVKRIVCARTYDYPTCRHWRDLRGVPIRPSFGFSAGYG